MTLKDVLTVTENTQRIILVHDFEEVTTTTKELSKRNDLHYSVVDAIETSNDGGVQYLVIGLK